MKRFVLLAAAGLALSVPGGARQTRVADFSHLPQGDVLVIHYHSSGCFHTTEATLEYRSFPKPVIVVRGKGRKVLRPTQEEIRGLDALLRFYRSPRSSGCTTIDTVMFNQVHDGITVATETFTDASCSSFDQKGVLRIPELLTRAEPSAGR